METKPNLFLSSMLYLCSYQSDLILCKNFLKSKNKLLFFCVCDANDEKNKTRNSLWWRKLVSFSTWYRNNNSSNSATEMAVLLDLQFSLLFSISFYASIPENVNQSNYFSTGKSKCIRWDAKGKSLTSMSVPLCVCLFPTL